MKQIFIDTNAWIALNNKNDHHFKQFGFTTNLNLD